MSIPPNVIKTAEPGVHFLAHFMLKVAWHYVVKPVSRQIVRAVPNTKQD
jgi:hypothetical protein